MKKDYSLYCSYCPIVGWRVRAITDHAIPKVQVVIYNGIKLMRIPSSSLVKRGRFLNPKTNALNWVKELQVKKPVSNNMPERALKEMLKSIIRETSHPISCTYH